MSERYQRRTLEQRERALEATRRWRARNAEKMSAAAKSYRARPEIQERLKEREAARYQADPDAARARSKAYYWANREVALAKIAERRKRDPETVRARDRAAQAKRGVSHSAKLKKWRRDNPDKVYADKAIRRARIKNAPRIERVDRFKVYARDKGICHVCRRKAARDGFHVDHLVPLCAGGDHTYANVAVTHPLCNLRRARGRFAAQLALDVAA